MFICLFVIRSHLNIFNIFIVECNMIATTNCSKESTFYSTQQLLAISITSDSLDMKIQTCNTRNEKFPHIVFKLSSYCRHTLNVFCQGMQCMGNCLSRSTFSVSLILWFSFFKSPNDQLTTAISKTAILSI